jgi:predicted Zn-dependent peptidase
MNTPEYAKTVLENGVRVITESVPGMRSLALGIGIAVGSAWESDAEAGLSHLVEHLVFAGTSNRTAEQIAQALDLTGGEIGAFTGRDYTCYYSAVLDEHAPYALDLFGDLLLNPTFPEPAVAREVSTIGCELASRGDLPADLATDALKELVWAGHPLGRPIAGTAERLQKRDREDAIYFFHRHYTPDRFVVTAAGGVDHADFVAQARDAFWRLLGETTVAPPTPAAYCPAVRLIHQPVAQAYFALGLPAPAYADRQRYELFLLNDLLAGSASARLPHRLREELGWVYQIGSEYQAYRAGGLLVVSGSTTPEHLMPVLVEIGRQMEALASGQTPASEDEVWRTQTRLRRQHLLGGADMSTRMSRLLTQEMYFGRQLPEAEIVQALAALSVEQVQTVAQTRLAEMLAQPALVVVAPEAPSFYNIDSLRSVWGVVN